VRAGLPAGVSVLQLLLQGVVRAGLHAIVSVLQLLLQGVVQNGLRAGVSVLQLLLKYGDDSVHGCTFNGILTCFLTSSKQFRCTVSQSIAKGRKRSPNQTTSYLVLWKMSLSEFH
jgi:hypothetical protein